METTLAPTRKRHPSAPVAWTAAATFAALALALVLASILHPPSANAPTQLKLPAAVTAANCIAVAKQAHLLKTKMTDMRVGAYYAAWVSQLAGGQPVTRTTLFNAGIAVAVCLR